MPAVGDVQIDELTIVEPIDAVIRVAVCGSDLWPSGRVADEASVVARTSHSKGIGGGSATPPRSHRWT